MLAFQTKIRLYKLIGKKALSWDTYGYSMEALY